MGNQMLNNLPHRRQEGWKWTDVGAAVKTTSAGLSEEACPQFTVSGGVVLARGTGHQGDGQMAKLAYEYSGESWTIYVPAGLKNASVTINGNNTGHSHISIMIDKGAELNLTENYSGGAFINIDFQMHVASGAKLIRTVLHEDPADAARIVTACIAMEDQTEIEQYVLSFGAGLTRIETRIYGEGEGIKCDLHGAYLLGGKRHCDMTSHVELSAPSAIIRQSVKGVAGDKSRGVFQGKFHVKRAAQLTDAEMRHDAMMLSDTCEVRAKPELEIYADDVACAHGNTVGALDESALFYMRQRGIPAAQARALLTEAFVAEAFEGMADNTAFMAKITAWLEANS